jgi:hypothetical protein
VGLLFSISCHPSTVGGWSVSADYPGIACDLIDAQLGAQCSVFLQGAAGDTKAFVTGRTTDDTGLPCFRSAGFEGVAETGHLLADEVMAALKHLRPDTPLLRSAILESYWALQPLPERAEFEDLLGKYNPARGLSVREHLRRLERGLANPEQAAIWPTASSWPRVFVCWPSKANWSASWAIT